MAVVRSYFDAIDRIGGSHYVPTDLDILRCARRAEYS